MSQAGNLSVIHTEAALLSLYLLTILFRGDVSHRANHLLDFSKTAAARAMGCRWCAFVGGFEMGFHSNSTFIQHGGWVWDGEGIRWKIGCGGKVEK